MFLRFSLCAAVVMSAANLLPGADALQVVAASGKSVELKWTGEGALERADGPTFQKLAAATEPGHHVDRTIAPFGTYRYRVNSAGKFSNVVTVGPPPAGFQNIARTPKNIDPGNFGSASAIALDENGDPLVLFQWADPNGDGDRSDNEIRFVRWDRRSYAWTASIRVLTVGDIPDHYLTSFAVACDPDTGTLAAVIPGHEKPGSYLLSTDHGATWTPKPAPLLPADMHGTALAIAAGNIHLAINGENEAFYATGPLNEPDIWKKQPLQAPSGWKVQTGSSVELILDAARKPVVAFPEMDEAVQHFGYALWRPDSGPVSIVTAKGSPADFPSIALAATPTTLGAVFQIAFDENDEAHNVWYSQSSNGSAWAAPSKPPVDGPRSTNMPLGLTISSKGAIQAAFGSNSGSEGTVCGFPALSRSTDGTHWKTCSPAKAGGGDFGPQPPTLHMIEAPNDQAYLLWSEQTDNKFGQGILLWHER